MKAKISLTLSEDLLGTVDRMAGVNVSRSAFIKKILRNFVEQRNLQLRMAREIAAINRQAAQLNVEMSDTLTFQSRPD